MPAASSLEPVDSALEPLGSAFLVHEATIAKPNRKRHVLFLTLAWLNQFGSADR